MDHKERLQLRLILLSNFEPDTIREEEWEKYERIQKLKKKTYKRIKKLK